MNKILHWKYIKNGSGSFIIDDVPKSKHHKIDTLTRCLLYKFYGSEAFDILCWRELFAAFEFSSDNRLKQKCFDSKIDFPVSAKQILYYGSSYPEDKDAWTFYLLKRINDQSSTSSRDKDNGLLDSLDKRLPHLIEYLKEDKFNQHLLAYVYPTLFLTLLSNHKFEFEISNEAFLYATIEYSIFDIDKNVSLINILKNTQFEEDIYSFMERYILINKSFFRNFSELMKDFKPKDISHFIKNAPLVSFVNLSMVKLNLDTRLKLADALVNKLKDLTFKEYGSLMKETLRMRNENGQYTSDLTQYFPKEHPLSIRLNLLDSLGYSKDDIVQHLFSFDSVPMTTINLEL